MLGSRPSRMRAKAIDLDEEEEEEEEEEAMLDASYCTALSLEETRLEALLSVLLLL